MIPDPVSRPLLRVEEVAAELGIGRTAAYEACRRGELPTLHFGRRIFVPTARLLKMLGLDQSVGEEAGSLDTDRDIVLDQARNPIVEAGTITANRVEAQ